MTLRPLAAALLLSPALALAAPASGKAGAKPAPRPAAAAPAPRASPAELGGPEIGGLVGYEAADFKGLSLRADAELPVRRVGQRATLSVLGSLGYSRLTWKPGFGVEGTADVVKLVPALRLTYPVATKVDVFADGGVGVAWVSTKIDLPPAFGAADFTDSTFNLVLRIGVGAWYHATERLRVGVLLELDPFLGDFGFASRDRVSSGSQTTFLAQVGAQLRL